jgi:hypothetical protein
LLKDIVIFCATAAGKYAPEGKNEPFSKCTTTDLDMKLAIPKYEEGQISSAIACELKFCSINCEHHSERCCSHKRTCKRNATDEVHVNNKEM